MTGICPREGCANEVPRQRKFCCRSCATAAQERPGKPKQDMCGRDLHPMVGDNIRIGGDRRACKACDTAAGKVRAAKARAGRPARPQPAPKPAPPPTFDLPPAPPRTPSPPWRPPGWSAQPDARPRPPIRNNRWETP